MKLLLQLFYKVGDIPYISGFIYFAPIKQFAGDA